MVAHLPVRQNLRPPTCHSHLRKMLFNGLTSAEPHSYPPAFRPRLKATQDLLWLGGPICSPAGAVHLWRSSSTPTRS